MAQVSPKNPSPSVRRLPAGLPLVPRRCFFWRSLVGAEPNTCLKDAVPKVVPDESGETDITVDCVWQAFRLWKCELQWFRRRTFLRTASITHLPVLRTSYLFGLGQVANADAGHVEHWKVSRTFPIGDAAFASRLQKPPFGFK